MIVQKIIFVLKKHKVNILIIKKHKKLLSWYRNNCIASEGEYCNDLKVRSWAFYHEQINYQKIAEGIFINDKKHGEWIIWSIDFIESIEYYFYGDIQEIINY